MLEFIIRFVLAFACGYLVRTWVESMTFKRNVLNGLKKLREKKSKILEDFKVRMWCEDGISFFDISEKNATKDFFEELLYLYAEFDFKTNKMVKRFLRKNKPILKKESEILMEIENEKTNKN